MNKHEQAELQHPTESSGTTARTSIQPVVTLPEEKRIGIQNQLVLILHAHKCAKREELVRRLAAVAIQQSDVENSNQTPNYECRIGYCKKMKQVIQHVRQCPLEDGCTERSCKSTKQIIIHWQHCDDSNCPVCTDIRKLAALKSVQPANNSSNNNKTASLIQLNKIELNPEENSLWRESIDRKRVVEQFSADLLEGGRSTDSDMSLGFSQCIENEIFTTAKSYDDYIFLLAEKLYTSQKDLLHNGTFPQRTNSAESSGVVTYDMVCSICYKAVIENACSSRRLRCGHIYHMQCFNQWQTFHSTCPYCRCDI